ncbi:MAG: aldose epimerase family protein [Bacteroidales bacterium]
MKINIEKFGNMPNGQQVDIISMSHGNTDCIKLTDYGVKLVSLIIPDKNGNPTDVVLGYNTLEDYLKGNRFFGSNPGPFANRIGNARFNIDGTEYRFKPNVGDHLLHSGESALESVVWRHETGSDFVRFIHNSPDGEFGFPGNKIIAVTYKWSADLTLFIEYSVTTDKSTHINLTHHSYFNLDGEKSNSILDHRISINASHILEVDDNSIPSGNYIPVENTPFDLRNEQKIAERIFSDFPILQNTSGFDQCYVIDKKENELTHCACVIASQSGCTMDVYSTLPGLQFYTDNHDNGNIPGKSGKMYPIRSALCLEPQQFPNAPNIPAFPSTLLKPNENYYEIIQYQFNKISPR